VAGNTHIFYTTPVHLSFPEDTEDNNKRCNQDKCLPDCVTRIQSKELGLRVLGMQQHVHESVVHRYTIMKVANKMQLYRLIYYS
jgi:hypothetical protein